MLQKDMHGHFSEIASGYNDLRVTDLEPVLFIKGKLKSLPSVKAADIGCGAGRYDLLFFQHLNDLFLQCVDVNESMLEETANYLMENNVTRFETVKAEANELPLKDNSLDCVFTFNAVHHFNVKTFLDNVSRIIKQSGFVFIYTRLQGQNRRNIWGRYFPLFLEKEKRLYELDEMKAMVQSAGSLTIDSVHDFRYRRSVTLEQLLYKAKNRHYSTFSLYTEKELKDSIQHFQKNIRTHFSDPHNVEWFDENTMFVLRHR
jgi:ubiquinone/menaquinone biosynthesis C-methylase UbiE